MNAYDIKLKKPPRFRDVPQFTRKPTYAVDIPWDHLIQYMDKEKGLGGGIDLDPDFQRGHVWTPEKQVAFVEFTLRGGESARNLYFNCPGFSSGRLDNYVLVDGKQRLTAALAFLNNELPIFGGWRYSDFTDRMNIMSVRFRWNVNDLKTREEVLQWYLDLNTGGVVHTSEEIEKVKRMLAKERKKK